MGLVLLVDRQVGDGVVDGFDDRSVAAVNAHRHILYPQQLMELLKTAGLPQGILENRKQVSGIGLHMGTQVPIGTKIRLGKDRYLTVSL